MGKLVETVFIELTNSCNCVCASCPQSVWRKSDAPGIAAPFDRPKGFMPYDRFLQIVEQAWTITDVVNFSFFGEPMLHPEFERVLDYFKGMLGKHRKLVLFSNFTLATESVMHKLIEIGLTRLRVSLDAATSETFQRIRAGSRVKNLDGSWHDGDRFAKTCEKVEHWFRMKGHAATRHEFVVSSRNAHEVEPFVRRWLPLLSKQDTILTKSILSYGGTMLNDPFLNRAPCRLWSKENYLVVDWRGLVSPCNLDTNMDLVIGDANVDSLASIYHGRRRAEVRDGSCARTLKPCDTCLDGNNRNRDFLYRAGSSWNPKTLGVYQQGGVDLVKLRTDGLTRATG